MTLPSSPKYTPVHSNSNIIDTDTTNTALATCKHHIHVASCVGRQTRLIIQYHISYTHMCEFCSFGPNTERHGRDANDSSFTGFFSPDAIQAAILKAKQQEQSDESESSSDEDSDGT